MNHLPRIDLTTASRDKLIAHIDALEDILTSLLPPEDDAAWLRYRFKLTLTEARIVRCLMNGRCQSRHQLRAATRLYGDEYETKTIDVHLLRARRKLKRHGITIRNDWGMGFYIDPENLARLNAAVQEVPQAVEAA